MRLAFLLYRRLWGRLAFFACCVGMGAAFLLGISSLLDTVESSAAGRARELLSADADVSSARPFSARARALFSRLESEGVRSMEVVVFSSMLQGPGQGAPFLVSVKAVPKGYPFYGEIETEPAGSLRKMQGAEGLLEDNAGLQHGLKVGDTVVLGLIRVKLAGLLVKQPDRLLTGLNLAPQLVIPADLARKTGLLRFGSRLSHRRLFALPVSTPQEAAALKARLERELEDPYVSVTSYMDADITVRETFQRATLFFTLVSLVGLLLGSVGMAASVALFLESQADTVGLLRCLGLGPGAVTRLFQGLCLAIGVAGGILGAAAGWGLGCAGLAFARSWLGLQMEGRASWSWASLGQAVALCALISLASQAARIRALAAVSPLLALREESAELRPPRRAGPILLLLSLAGLTGFAWIRTNSPSLSLWFGAALGGAGLAVLGLTKGFMRLLGAVARKSDAARLFPVRHGLLQLARQPRRTPVFLFTLSLGFTLLGALSIVQRGFGRELLQGRRERSPNLFLVDVQRGQLKGVSELTLEASGSAPEVAPLIRARLTRVGGVPVEAKDLKGMTLEERSRQRFLTREYNLTYKDSLHEGEAVERGRFWVPGESAPQVSVERSFAKRLGLELGARLTFDIQGRSLEAAVTSIRSVDWMTMRPNFFVVFPEAVLKSAPQAFIGSFSLRDAGRAASYQRELLRRFPNVSVIDAGQALERVSALLGMLIDALRVLAWFCVAVGLLVMAGTLSLGREERRQRQEVLRALGCANSTMLAADVVEFAGIGAAAFFISAVVSHALGFALSRKMSIGFQPDLAGLALTLAAAVLPVIVGLLSARRPARG